MRRKTFAQCAGVLLLGVALGARAQDPPRAVGTFVNFESTQVRPLALAADGQWLFACNTPDNRVAKIATADMSIALEIPVGLEPVALAVHPIDGNVWVTNYLSDSVSVIDPVAGYVIRTLAVGDEPSDIVFHPSGSHAFVTLGQERALAVIDTVSLAVTKFAVDGDDPRAMAIDPNAAGGPTLYVTCFHSGNNTTIVRPENVHTEDQQHPEDYAHYDPGDPQTIPPLVARIIQDMNPNYQDILCQDVANPCLPFNTLDHDVIVYNISDPGAGMTPSAIIGDVGTLLNGISVNPQSGRLFITNTDARNFVRFEPNVRGHLVDHQVTIVDPAGGTSSKRDLHAELPSFNDVSAPNPEAQAISLAEPMAIVTNAAGDRAYITAFGVDRVGVLDVTEGGDFIVLARIDVGPGPSGLALDNVAQRLYCLNRFDQTISVVDLAGDSNTVVQTVSLGYNPEPATITDGRAFLYSSKRANNWGSACATCHAGADTDRLVWDLGDPNGPLVSPPGGLGGGKKWHPMKGPMRTQSLRGLVNHQPFHFRGDRPMLNNFNPAFASLIGGTPLNGNDITALKLFLNSIVYPPNPNRNLDNSFVDPVALGGQSLFVSGGSPAGMGFVCAACHVATNDGTNNQIMNQESTTGEPQLIKVTQLRHLVDLFPFQYSGFGVRHNGMDITLRKNLEQPFFPLFSDAEKDAFEAFLKAFPTNVWPVVGHQVTVDSSNAAEPSALDAINAMIAQAAATPSVADVVAKGWHQGSARGFVLADALSNTWQSDREEETVLLADLLAAASNGQAVLTFTAVPPCSGTRIGIDRDLDGWGDQSEIDLGTSPDNAASVPAAHGDSDADADIDLRDAAKMFNCLTSEPPAGLPPCAPGCGALCAPGCAKFDFNNDQRVTLSDYAALLAVFTGPGG
ncbi:MAG TPA: hypothetical protein VGM03_10050 [Phycisphaerae bacterium]